MSGEDRTCNVHETGVCAMHQVEVERRKNDNENLRKLMDLIPKMLTRINTMVGYSLLATLLIVGGFYYSSEIKADSHEADSKIRSSIDKHEVGTDRRINQLTTQVTELTVAMARSEEKHTALMTQMSNVMLYMKAILGSGDNGNKDIKDLTK